MKLPWQHHLINQIQIKFAVITFLHFWVHKCLNMLLIGRSYQCKEFSIAGCKNELCIHEHTVSDRDAVSTLVFLIHGRA